MPLVCRITVLTLSINEELPFPILLGTMTAVIRKETASFKWPTVWKEKQFKILNQNQRGNLHTWVFCSFS